MTSEIPNTKWKHYHHSQFTLNVKQKVMYLLQQPDSTYDEIRAALMECTTMTFAATAEAIFTDDNGKLVQLPLRAAMDKVCRWITKFVRNAETIKETLDSVSISNKVLHDTRRQDVCKHK